MTTIDGLQPARRAWIAGAIAALGAGCYAPDLRDCSVTCREPADCADDHVCTSTGFCAAAGVTCSGAAQDAGAAVTLTIRIDGTGRVVVAGVGDCDDSECVLQAPRTTLHLIAEQIDPDKPFDKWTTDHCGDDERNPSCVLVVSAAAITVGAKFK